MFIGHFAVGLAAKRAAPRTSLATLVAAATFVDILWPLLVLAGVETVRIDPGNTAFTPLDFVSYPWTHSLLMGLAWGAAFGLAYRARTGYGRGAWVVAALVLSHWVLDWISHRPDMPLAPGLAARYGLGLWNSVPATLAVELVLFAAGLGLYLATTRARNRKGSIGLWAFVAFLLLSYFGNLGQVPPGVAAVAVVGLIGVAISLAWIWWFDRNREVRTAPALEPPRPAGLLLLIAWLPVSSLALPRAASSAEGDEIHRAGESPGRPGDRQARIRHRAWTRAAAVPSRSTMAMVRLTRQVSRTGPAIRATMATFTAALASEATMAPIPATRGSTTPREARVAAEATAEALERRPPARLTA